MDAQALVQSIIQATAVQVDPNAAAQRRAEAVQFFEQVCCTIEHFYVLVVHFHAVCDDVPFLLLP
jgi:hypothetical protein